MREEAAASMAVGRAIFLHMALDGRRRNHGLGDGSEMTINVHARDNGAQRTMVRMRARPRGRKGTDVKMLEMNWTAIPWTT